MEQIKSTENKYILRHHLSPFSIRRVVVPQWLASPISMEELKCALMDGFQVMSVYLFRASLSEAALKSVEVFLCGLSCAQGRGERWFICKEVGS